MRGDLTKWCQEIQVGVYVGNVNARIRSLLWKRINDNIGNGEATLVYNTNNELGYTFLTTRKDKKVIDVDGIPLMMSLYMRSSNKSQTKFSNAYHHHQARIHQKQIEVKEKDFVAVDLETTGLNPTKDQIISIGAVKQLRGEISTFYSLVKLEPQEKLPINISKLTGLKTKMLINYGSDLKDVLENFRTFIGKLPLVGFNFEFDEQFLRIATIKSQIAQIDNNFFDLLLIVKKVNNFLDPKFQE